MRRTLIVGCGGSGGAVLGYMMDEIRAELAAHGIEKIPGGWQFVHVDVPVDADGNPSLRVKDQGGTYIPTGPGSGMTYEGLDTQVVSTLAQGGKLAETATWLPPEPHKITVNISAGAGQLRALGRAITLSKARSVQQGLQDAWTRMFTAEADREMHDAVTRAKAVYPHFDSAQDPLVVVVSSMAGGAGASMALDVCRILTSIPALNPTMMGVFMIAPDVFDTLAPMYRTGVRANGLAMLGEILAAQTRAAGKHDKAVLAPYAVQVNDRELPFARVFPVGRKRGLNGALVGDGSMGDVYRGLGRGLSALIASDEAIDPFVAYDLVNSTPTPQKREIVGWGEISRELQWGSFGYSRLSLGRDRYRHYAAQRIARSAVDRLREGHLQVHDSAAGDVQLRRLVDSQWPVVVQRTGLPADGTPDTVRNWFLQTAFPQQQASATAAQITQEHVAIPSPIGMTAQQWEAGIGSNLAQARGGVQQAFDAEALRRAYGWAQGLLTRVQEVVSDGVATFGVPYGREVVARVQRMLEDVLLPQLQGYEAYVGDALQFPPQTRAQLATTKGTIANDGVRDVLVQALAGQVSKSMQLRWAGHVAKLLPSLSSDGVGPLSDALGDSLAVLEHAVNSPAVGVGLADVKTDAYRAWPSEHDGQVPDRFKVAHNEILITPAATFPGQFEADLVRSTDPVSTTLPAARQAVDRAVVTGLWPVGDGFEAPGGLLAQTATWHPASVAFDPETGAPRTQSRAAYRYSLSPRDLVARALKYVSRAHTSFDDFCSVSLKDYANDQAVNEVERASRHADLVAKFREAKAAAEPLAQVEPMTVQTVHDEPVSMQYKFSAIPFSEESPLSQDLLDVVMSDNSVAPTTKNNWKNDRNSTATRIDVFGSYKPYSPLVFSGLWEPVRQDWSGLADFSREDFWGLRRSRPLEASLPVGELERRAMIVGWYIGRITGLVKTPGSPYTDPVTIWDPEQERARAFPSPLLTPPSRFRAAGYDWMPAVLESMLVALTEVQLPPVMDSLQPYKLLRELSDSSPNEPAKAGGLTATPTGLLALGRWLRDGRLVPGDQIEGTSIDDRLENAKARLGEQLGTISQGLSPTTGPKLGRRQEIGNSPMARELADDSVWAIRRVKELLDQAAELARSGGLDGPAAAPVAAVQGAGGSTVTFGWDV